jgi:hypothetical protein
LVQVRLEPWKEIVFHDAQQLDLKELTRLQAMSNELAQTMAPLSWVDGIVYATMPMLESEELAAEQLHGRIHFASILFSFMPAYAETIRSGRVDIPIVHLGYNTVSRALASWIKGNFKPKANETGKGT